MDNPANKLKPATEGGLKAEPGQFQVEGAGLSAGKDPSTFNPQPSTPPPRVPAWLLAVLLALATIALYWPATHNDFVSLDDPDYVTSNVHVQNGLTVENIGWAFSNPIADNWHPVTMLSLMLDSDLFGPKPWGYHLTNLLLHALNTALVFLLLRSMTGALWRSAAVAALFAAHPLHVESVAWVAERKDVLSTCFGLLALLVYVQYAQKKSLNSQPSTLNYCLALLFFALGLMSKSMLVTWPFVMLLLDYWPLERFAICDLRFTNFRSFLSHVTRHVSLFKEKIPFFGLAVVSCFITMGVQGQGGAFEAGRGLPFGARAGNALVSCCRYLEKTFWPTDLAVFYPHPVHWPLDDVVFAGIVLCVVTALCLCGWRRYPFLQVGWFWFLGTLVPVIGLVQVGGQAMADRYTYIPSVGLFVLLVWGAFESTRRWRQQVVGLTMVGIAAIAACCALTWHQLGYWTNSETLFRHTLAVTEKNEVVHNILGTTLGDKGQVNEAISEFREAIRIRPDYGQAHYNLGYALFTKGELDKAMVEFQEAIRLKLDYQARFDNLSKIMEMNNLAWELATSPDARLRDGTRAVELAERACQLTDYRVVMMVGTLAAAYAEAGRFNEAIATGQKACALAEKNGETNLLKNNQNLIALYQKHQAYHEPPSNSNASPVH